MEGLDLLRDWDVAVRAWLTTHHHPLLDIVMVGLSRAGTAGTLWLALTAILTWRDRRRLRGAAAVVLALVLSYGLTDGVLKPLVARERPFVTDDAVRLIQGPPATYSFPSGHAASSIAAAVTLSRLWPPGRLLLWPLAILVALSRIYVGVHYPADVIGGGLLGLVCAWIAVRILSPRTSAPPAGPSGSE